MQGIETAFECMIAFSFTFTFEIRDHTYSVYTKERQYLPCVLQDQILVSGARDL